jgi:hypothetical protein
LCCFDSNTTCNDDEWLGHHEGIWEFGYERVRWDFEKGAVSPLIDYNLLQSLPNPP